MTFISRVSPLFRMKRFRSTASRSNALSYLPDPYEGSVGTRSERSNSLTLSRFEQLPEMLSTWHDRQTTDSPHDSGKTSLPQCHHMRTCNKLLRQIRRGPTTPLEPRNSPETKHTLKFIPFYIIHMKKPFETTFW